MTFQTFNEAVYASIADGTAVANTVTETIMVDDWTFPAYYFYPGRKVRVSLWGVISNVVTAVPTLTIRARIGSATLSATWVSASGALAANATANTNLTWYGVLDLVCRTAGTAGTGFLSGQVWLPNLTAGNAVGNVGYPNLIPASAPAAGTLNTKIANVLSVSAQWSAANAANSITVNQHLIEALT